MAATFALIPGAGGRAWYWHRVTPLLAERGHRVTAPDLPAADDTADLRTYADVVLAAIDDAPQPVLVAQSMGAYTAGLVAQRCAPSLVVLVNPMVPAPGESAGQWWQATGQRAAMVENFRRIGLGRTTFNDVEDFFHDVPADVRAEALATPEPDQSDTPFGQPWPLDRWPDVPTRVLVGRDDRLFPPEFQRRVVRDRLGVDVEEMAGGHLLSLSQPQELAGRLLGMLPS
jgi:pimeloyl-ACP methyl ester carboxylesterase